MTKLYEDLGILNAPARKVKAFSTELHQWRKSYKTRTARRPATLLKDWNDPNVQSDLKEVAEAFFEEHRESYWSADLSWHPLLQYTEDKHR
jgi:hypothetical protein